jgi:hypothetical protein
MNKIRHSVELLTIVANIALPSDPEMIYRELPQPVQFSPRRNRIQLCNLRLRNARKLYQLAPFLGDQLSVSPPFRAVKPLAARCTAAKAHRRATVFHPRPGKNKKFSLAPKSPPHIVLCLFLFPEPCPLTPKNCNRRATSSNYGGTVFGAGSCGAGTSS